MTAPADTSAGPLILTVAAEGAGERLDRYLAARVPDVSRATIQKWIADQHVQVEGQIARAALRLTAGQTIRVEAPAPPRPIVLAQHIALALLYEDDYLAVIDKPAGMVVHPAAGHWDGTLVNALLARYPDLNETAGGEDETLPASDEFPRPGIVHRLDKDTSGVILIAKSPRIAELLQAQFQAHQVQKTYLALVLGRPRAASGFIDAPIGRDPHQRKRMAVTPAGRPARTRYTIASEYAACTLLHVFPQTGRTHQIRVHLAYIGHPIVGDDLYGRRKSPLPCPRQCLHAWRIAFTHPITHASLTFEAPIPEDLRQMLATLAEPGF